MPPIVERRRSPKYQRRSKSRSPTTCRSRRPRRLSTRRRYRGGDDEPPTVAEDERYFSPRASDTTNYKMKALLRSLEDLVTKMEGHNSGSVVYPSRLDYHLHLKPFVIRMITLGNRTPTRSTPLGSRRTL